MCAWTYFMKRMQSDTHGGAYVCIKYAFIICKFRFGLGTLVDMLVTEYTNDLLLACYIVRNS